MSTAHTQGPWETNDLTGKPINDPSVISAKHCLATVWINDISRKQAAANARLMAAAPDMLEALKWVETRMLGRLPDRNTMSEAEIEEYTQAYEKLIRAAIAKAEGRTP